MIKPGLRMKRRPTTPVIKGYGGWYGKAHAGKDSEENLAQKQAGITVGPADKDAGQGYEGWYGQHAARDVQSNLKQAPPGITIAQADKDAGQGYEQWYGQQHAGRDMASVVRQEPDGIVAPQARVAVAGRRAGQQQGAGSTPPSQQQQQQYAPSPLTQQQQQQQQGGAGSPGGVAVAGWRKGLRRGQPPQEEGPFNPWQSSYTSSYTKP